MLVALCLAVSRGEGMQNLIYSLITEKEAKRHIKIMEMLSANRKRLEYEEIRNELDVTVKTIKSDVEEIQKIMPHSMEIICNKKHISLVASSNEAIQAFIFGLVKKTLSYRILDYAYKEPVISMEELAKHLFTSQTTLKNRIKQMNTALGQFRCKFSSYNSALIGPEANIRYLFYAYYTELQEVYNITSYQGMQEHQKLFDALGEELISQKLNRINCSYVQLRQWLRVTTDRMAAGHALRLGADLVEKIKLEPPYKDFRAVYSTIISKYFQLMSISEDEIIWAYIVCLDAVVYSKHFSDLEMRRKDRFAKFYQKKVLGFVVKLAEGLRIEHAERTSFTQVHCAFFENVCLLSKITPVFQIASASIKGYTRQNLKLLYHLWHTQLTGMKVSHGLAFMYMDDLCCKLAMITSQFIYNKRPNIKTALFSFAGEAGIPNYLETMARNVFPKEIECVFVFNELLSMDLIRQVKPEIVVCNYNIIEDIPFANLVRVPYLPTIKDWTALMDRVLRGNAL